MLSPMRVRSLAASACCAAVALTTLLGSRLVAQSSNSATTKESTDSDTVTLSPFEVSTERDRGFAATSALAGGRLATDLKDTPIAYSVINQEFIQALGITDLSQAAEWTTNSYRFPDGAGGGDLFNITTPVAVRGILSNNGLRQRNFFIYYSENDSYNIERFDFGRGPNQILFGNGSIGGTQVTMTKRVRFDRSRASVEATYGSWDNKRVTIDINQPLNQQLGVRAAAVWADRDGWRMGEMEKRKAGFLTGSYRPFKNTEVRIEGELGEIQRRTPDAKLTDRLGGWNGTYNASLLATLPSNSGALGIDRRPGNYFVYNPNSGADNTIYQLTNWAMTRGAGDTTTTPAGGYLQVGSTNWNQSGATILNAVDVAPNRFATALANSKFFIPDRWFTNAALTPLLTSKFNDLQATISQQVGQNLYFEIAGDVNQVHNNINRIEGDAIATYIDINPTLPGGATNPNYLRPYGDGRFWYYDRNTDAKSIRAAVAYILDLGKWGNYSFNLMGGLTHQKIGNFNYILAPGISTGQFADPRQWGNNNGTGFGLRQRFYWGDTLNYRVPTGPITYVANDGTSATATPTWVPTIGDSSENNVSLNDNDYNYLLAAMNAKFFHGRLVIVGAARYDDSKQHVSYLVRQGDFPSNWDKRTLVWRPDAPADWSTLMYTPVGATTPLFAITRPRTADANGVQIANPAYANVRFADDYNPPPVTFKGWMPSTGAVVHVTNWSSVYGNYSRAIAFNTAAAPDVNGKLLPVVTGKGWDAGTRFNLFGNRVNIGLGTYRNTEYGNYVDPTSVTNQINTLYQANVLGDTTTGGRNKRNAADINGLVRDTRTRIAKGYEIEVVTNLTRNWRVTANMGLPDVTEKNYAPMTRAYVAANAELFKQVLDDAGGTVNSNGVAVLKPGVTDTGTGGSESTGNEAARAVNAYNTLYTNLGGFVLNSRQATSNPRTLNVFTDYSFSHGWLKGLRTGIGVNWRGKRVVGYRNGDTIATGATTAADDPSVDGYTPVYAPGASLWTATLGYTWKLSHGRQLVFNFRVSNLFNESDVIWTDTTTTLRPKGGDFTSPARETVYNPYAYQIPRAFSFSTRFDF